MLDSFRDYWHMFVELPQEEEVQLVPDLPFVALNFAVTVLLAPLRFREDFRSAGIRIDVRFQPVVGDQSTVVEEYWY